jgi:hypothetical protein
MARREERNMQDSEIRSRDAATCQQGIFCNGCEVPLAIEGKGPGDGSISAVFTLISTIPVMKN